MESGITGTFGGLLGRNFTTSATISSFKVGIALGVGGEIGFESIEDSSEVPQIWRLRSAGS